MAESITQSETKQQQTAETLHPSTKDGGATLQIATAEPGSFLPPIVIWTPRFMVIFAVILTIGLSVASLLTQGLENHYYNGNLVLIGESVLICIASIVLSIRTRSFWVRIGGIFGCLWALLTAMSFMVNMFFVEPDLPIVAHLNAAMNVALFGCYICLSINRTPLYRWDTWYFRIVPLIGFIIVGLTYLFTGSPLAVESVTAAVALYLCICTWWFRPSCWQKQPGPTFLFGLAPMIALILSIPHAFNGRDNFFLLQVIFVCILLAMMRTTQGELREVGEKTTTPLI
jgi:hypothetical protein